MSTVYDQAKNQALYYSALTASHTAKERVQVYLRSLPEIRLYVEESPGMGHQTSTVNVLKRLIELIQRQSTRYVLIYRDAGTLSVLQRLLPGIDKSQTEQVIEVMGHQVEVIELDEFSSSEQYEEIEFGLSGGFDNNDDERIDPLNRLAVKHFLALMPYLFEPGKSNSSSRIVYYDEQKAALLPVLKELQLRFATSLKGFAEMAYYLPLPQDSQINWTAYANAEDSKQQVEMLQLILTNLQHFNFCPGYGIGKGNAYEIKDYERILMNLATGILYAQTRDFSGNKRKSVLVVFGSYEREAEFKNLLTDATTHGLENFRKYRDVEQLGKRIKFVSESFIDSDNNNASNPVEALKKELASLQDNELLIVFIKPVPGEVFNYALSQASLPFFFEGEGTASLAFNLGKPFFFVSTPDAMKQMSIKYPSMLLPNFSNGGAAKCCQQHANSMLQPLTQWQPDFDLSPAFLLGDFIAQCYQAQPTTLMKYFDEIKQVYHNEENDKLIVSADFFIKNFIEKSARKP